MESDEEVASAIRSNIRWLTVDEYQDVSPLQHRLLTRWLGSNRNICVVGDPAQTIYSFAGASSYSLLNFDSEFGPLTADINLNNDYRSTPQIVNYANRVLAASPQRADYLKLSSERSKGRRVVETIYGSDWEEAQGVADLSGVTISTIHASKGLEFKHVFLIGCSEGLIPYGLPQDDDVLEEERRLMYVAVTRAEDTLDVSYARTREGNEGERARRVSRFFR